MFAVQVYYKGYPDGFLIAKDRDFGQWSWTLWGTSKGRREFATEEEAEQARQDFLSTVISFKAKIVNLETEK